MSGTPRRKVSVTQRLHLWNVVMISIANGTLLNLDWIYSWAQAQPSDRRYVGSFATVARGIILKQNLELVHFKFQYHCLQDKIQTFYTNPPMAYISLNL